jgi:hypothetical protein
MIEFDNYICTLDLVPIWFGVGKFVLTQTGNHTCQRINREAKFCHFDMLSPGAKPASGLPYLPVLKSRQPFHVCLAGGSGMMEDNKVIHLCMIILYILLLSVIIFYILKLLVGF